MESYEHALLSGNFTFDDWNSNQFGFDCMETSQSQYVMLCKDKWDNLGVAMEFYKTDKVQSEWTLTIVLMLIAFKLLIILGLVTCILLKYRGTTKDRKLTLPSILD